MHKLIIILVLFVQAMLAGNITIAVAANVSYAIEELTTEFEKVAPNIKVSVVLGSSGKLTAQIKNGAPYGLFMSADMKYPQALFEADLAMEEPAVYAQGALAYFSAKKRDFTPTMALLAHSEIRRIAIANPKTAPYGKAALEVLKNAKIYEAIKSKLVYAESISQTVSYAVTAADLGLIAKSSLYSAKMTKYKEKEHWLSVDTKLYAPIKQGIVLLKHAKGDGDYKVFYDFILSDRAKKIFEKYGYII